MKTEPDYNAILESSQTESGFSYQTSSERSERRKRPSLRPCYAFSSA